MELWEEAVSPRLKSWFFFKREIAKEYLLSREIILKAYFPQTQQMYSQVCTL